MRRARCCSTSDRGEWDDELCELFRVPRALLPEVRDCAGDFGATDRACSAAPMRILGVAGDQQAATVGQGCFEPGMMKSTYGTGCFALLNTGATPVASRNRLLTTIAYQLDGKRTYALEGAIFIAGAAVQWLRDGAQADRDRAPSRHARGRRRSGRAGLSGAGLCRARRAVVGCGGARRDLTASRAIPGAAELARAALEAVGYQTRDLLDAMRADWPAAERQDGAARRRRHGGERFHHAVPRRHPGGAGRPAGGHGDDRARRGLSRGPHAAGSVPISTGFAATWSSTAASSRAWMPRRASANGAAGTMPCAHIDAH